MTDTEKISAKDIREGAGLAALSYVCFLWILAFIYKKENKFSHFHAKQGLVLFMARVIVIAVSVFMPWLAFISRIAFFVLVLLSFYGLFSALMGKAVKIPVISDIAEKMVV